VGIANRIKGRLVGRYVEGLTRAQKIARAELGTTALASAVLLAATRPMRERLRALLRKPRRRGDTYRGRIGGRDVSIVNTGIGAPSAEGKVVACLGLGARLLVRLDLCGGLREEMAVGEIVVATSAIPYDNTTRSLAGEAEIAASPALVAAARTAAAGREIKRRRHYGPVATVDTFHHQTDAHHRAWARRAVAVDMETSILYHLARQAGAHALAVMAVSDVRLAGLDPFGEAAFPFDEYYQALDEVTVWGDTILRNLPDPLPPLEGGVERGAS
jgi:purine-nucleoside phosphorylase